jgi:aminomethyltransferase
MKTALFDAHQKLGAKMIDFGGWQMPLLYQGIIKEHEAVRSRVGIFDVSHMGRIEIDGLGAEALMEYLSTNTVTDKTDGTATYTVWCNEEGKTVDDLIVYKISKTKFFVIVNAANRQKDFVHVLHYSTPRDVIINNHYEDEGILAVQGPKSLELMTSLFPEVHSLKHMHFLSLSYKGKPLIISRTGYTGENGVEIYVPNSNIVDLWNLILEKGKFYGIEPIGLGARDTLRLEMGYALYGHELSESIMPHESVSSWTIKWNKTDFIGKKALESHLNQQRYQYGIILKEKGIARENYPVLQNEQQIGVVTSGTLSPTLNQAIAIIMVDKKLQEGDEIEVQIRQNYSKGQVVNLPFYSEHSQYEGI